MPEFIISRTLVFALAVLTSLAGRAAPLPNEHANLSLAGTTWELVSIQSMDDAQGTIRITNPELFTVSFYADDNASFKLDCNRGTSSWEIKPSSDATSGTLQFGPIAATRAICRTPHIDERVVRDLGFVRGYLFKDSKLFMTLMADGGIYEWQPQGSTESAKVGQVLGASISTKDAEELRTPSCVH